MDYKKYTYEELKNEHSSLFKTKNEIMDKCAKEGASFDDYATEVKEIAEKMYFISREMRLKESPIMEYGKTWKGEFFTIEEFLKHCKDKLFTNEDGVGYYATENAKSNIMACPSDFKDDVYRTDFTHVIWFNK